MCLKVLVLVAVTEVCFVVSASVSRRSKLDERKFSPQPARGAEPHYIYPRTGRLFHADYVRDNEIFKSLERTNFMRRGPFALPFSLARAKRNEDHVEKKRIFIGAGKLSGVGTKKGFLPLDKDVPAKAVLVKISETTKESHNVNRTKRDVKEEKETPVVLKEATSKKQEDVNGSTLDKSTITGNKNLTAEDNNKDKSKEKIENEVEEDSFPHIKNNDTDKTLFVHDNTARVEHSTPGLDTLEPEKMKKTVVDQSMHLYPVYRGVKYHYPLHERRVVYSPQLTVQMDLPVVSEYLTVQDKNTTTGEEGEDSTSTTVGEVEGRSRRPLKKLALPLLLALKLKTAILLPLILGLISLISFKGLWSGLTALGIAAALGLKALVVSSGPKVVVQNPPPPPPPHVHHFGPHEFTEYWSRRGDDFNDYRPPNTWS